MFLYFCIFCISLFKATFLFLGRCFCIFVLLYLYCQIQFLSICCIFVSSLRPCYHCRCRLSLESCQFLFWPKFLFFIICSVFHFSSKMGRQSLINLIPNQCNPTGCNLQLSANKIKDPYFLRRDMQQNCKITLLREFKLFHFLIILFQVQYIFCCWSLNFL